MELQALGSAAALAMLLVPLISLVKRDSWTKKTKQAVALGAAFVAALGGAFIDGNISNLSEGIAYFATARVVAETLYVQYFGGTEFNTKLEAKGNVTAG